MKDFIKFTYTCNYKYTRVSLVDATKVVAVIECGDDWNPGKSQLYIDNGIYFLVDGTAEEVYNKLFGIKQ